MGMIARLLGREPKVETRAAGSGFTSEILSAREAWISGRRGLAELTGAVQACVSLWEGALSLADVTGTDLLDRRSLALCARSLALRGEWVAIIGDGGLIPVSDWDLSTRDGRPRAYRLSVPEVGGGRSETKLAAEVLHVVLGPDPAAPWSGISPLRRASLSAGLLHAVESALAEVYELAPIGSQVVPMPENPAIDNATLGRSFRGQRGRVLLRESVTVTAAGGPVPATDWRPASLSPDLRNSMAIETLEAARGAVLAAFGVLPSLFAPNAQGPQTREAQRHLATWTLQPIAELVAEEASRKLGAEVAIDVHRPLQSFDQGGSARAVATLVEALARAKEAGLSDAAVAAAFGALDWTEAFARRGKPVAKRHKPVAKRHKPDRPDPREAARKALAARLAGLMAAAEPTAFALEGPARAALRARFILHGGGRCRWTAADVEARGIVAGALQTLGPRGKRPTWQEGQPDYCGPVPIERSRCLNCGAPLPGDNPARKHCSSLCRHAFAERMRYRAQVADGTVIRLLAG